MEKIVEFGRVSGETKGTVATNQIVDGFKLIDGGVRYQAGNVLNKSQPAPL